MSQVITNTGVPLSVEHPQHANHSTADAADEISPAIEHLQILDQDAVYGTASAGTGATEITRREVQTSRTNIIIIQLTATTLLASTSSGFINICIPRMATDLKIAPALYFW